MVKFTIKTKDFKKFLDAVSCKGTLQFKSKGKVDAPLFSAFFIEVDDKENKLRVLSLDTYFNKIKQLASIGAKVEEGGIIEITDKSVFDTIFKNLDGAKPIIVSCDGDAIYIESQEGDWYKRRIVGDKALDEITNKEKELNAWKDSHDLVSQEGIGVWRITLGTASAIYPMRIKVKKDDLKKFVADAVTLTKDNNTIIISEGENIEIWSGTPNSTNQSKHRVPFENIGKEIIDFSVKFSALQGIVPNLQDEIILNFRKTSEDTVVLRIETMDANFYQILSIGSQDKDGVLYEEEEEIPER